MYGRTQPCGLPTDRTLAKGVQHESPSSKICVQEVQNRESDSCWKKLWLPLGRGFWVLMTQVLLVYEN